MKMVKEVYYLTASFPRVEQFGLTNQIQRSAVSIPCNIAEGAGKRSKIDFNRFLSIAMGSCNELETQLILSRELNYISKVEYESVEKTIHRIQNMLFGLQRSLRST